MKNYKLFYIQNNTKEIIEIVYINWKELNMTKDFQARINFNGKNYIYFGMQEF
jgi:hypothetical protein